MSTSTERSRLRRHPVRRGVLVLTTLVVLLLALTPILNVSRLSPTDARGAETASDLTAESDVDVAPAEEDPTETPTETPPATATETEAASATATSTEAASSTPTETPVPTSSATQTPIETSTGTATPTSTGTSTATLTSTATSTTTLTATATSTATSTATTTATSTRTPRPTRTATPRPTRTATPVARLSVSSTSGSPGSEVRVQIGNFSANTRVAITFDDDRQLTLTTDRSGSARGAFEVPAAAAGSHEIVAKGGGRSASRPFSVRPRLELSTSNIVAGRSLTVTLSGFGAGKTVKVRLYDVGSSSRYALLGELRTNARGGASESLTIPRTAKGGVHKVVAYQTSSSNDDANVRVTALTATPKPTRTPTPSPTRTATPRPSVCNGARSWLQGTFNRNDYVISAGNDAITLWNANRLSVAHARDLSAEIAYRYDQQKRSNPPSAANTLNGHIVLAYAEYSSAIYWLAVNVQARINGDANSAYLAYRYAVQDFEDGDNAIGRANNALPAFRDRCDV